MKYLPEPQLPCLLSWLPLFSMTFSGSVSNGQRYTSVWCCTGEGYPSFELEKLGATSCQTLPLLHLALLSFSNMKAWGGLVTPMQQQLAQGLGCRRRASTQVVCH